MSKLAFLQLIPNRRGGGNGVEMVDLCWNCNMRSLEKSENFVEIGTGSDKNAGTSSAYMAFDGLGCVEVIF